MKCRAVSLVEILVVIGIIALLLGILLPVLVHAKREAKATDNTSRLHQMGLAAQLYHEQTDAWPWSTSDLVNKKLIDSGLCKLYNDPTLNGLGNAVAAEKEAAPPSTPLQTPYLNSVIGLREFRINHDAFKDWIEPSPAGGWALDITASKRPRTNWDMLEGRYKRLCFDGSVQVRTFASLDCSYNGTPSPCRMPIAFFLDPTDEFREWVKQL